MWLLLPQLSFAEPGASRCSLVAQVPEGSIVSLTPLPLVEDSRAIHIEVGPTGEFVAMGETPRVQLTVLTPSFVPWSQDLSCEGEQALELELVPGSLPVTLQIDSFAAEGPPPGATLLLSRVSKHEDERQPMAVAAQAEVAFSLPRGQGWRALANAEGHAPEWTELSTELADRLDLRLFLQPFHSIHGTVLDAQGQPVPEASVTRMAEDQAEPVTITCGPDGRFRFPVSPGVPMHLFAQLDGSIAQHDLIPDGRTKDLTLTLEAGATVRGQLTDHLGAAMQSSVIWRHQPSGLMGQTDTDAQGRFVVSGLPRDGTVDVWHRAGAYDPVQVTPGAEGITVVAQQEPSTKNNVAKP